MVKERKTRERLIDGMAAKKKSVKTRKVRRVMREYKEGKLHSRSKKGPVVKSRKQAIAIALHEAGVSRKQSKKSSTR